MSLRTSLNTLYARLLIGAAIPVVLFVAVGVLSGILLSRFLHAQRLEKHSSDVIEKTMRVERILRILRDHVRDFGPAAAAARGDFALAVSRGDELAGAVHALVADSDEQKAAAAAVRDGLRDYVSAARRGEPLSRLDGRHAAVMDRVGDFIDAERRLHDERRLVVAAQARQSVPLIGAVTAVAMGLTVYFAIVAVRSVTIPVSRLRDSAQELMAGRYKSIAPAGPKELADLMVLFNHMALTLSRRTSLLAQEEERYRVYIGAVAHILWSANANGEVITDIPAWRAYTGQSESSVLGAGWMEAIHPDDRPVALEMWQSALRDHAPFQSEFRLRGDDGEYRWFDCRSVPIMNSDGEVREWIGTCTDTTEGRRKLELEQAMQAAEAANKAKSEFLTRMSHELRTPLNAVIGMSKMLKTQRFGALNAKQADYIDDISRAGEHLLALINDILDLAKVESGKMELQPDTFHLAEAVNTWTATLRPLADAKQQKMTLHPPREDGRVQTDPARFRQILFNLLSNAIKFTPAGGSVRVRWEWVDEVGLSRPSCRYRSANAFRVHVEDTGVGINPDEQESVWHEFRQSSRTADQQHQGTGLGLALVRRLVMLLGGQVALRSEPNKGSVFTFVLPRRMEPASQMEMETVIEPPADRPLALVVEDNRPTNKLLCDWLRDEGLATLPAYDGREGLDYARQFVPALIVLDIHLPQLDGRQLITELKADPRTAAVPVVVVSVGDEREVSGEPPVRGFFVKPVERDDFLGRLRTLLPALFVQGRRPRVLLVDDDPIARRLTSGILHTAAEVVEAGDGREALIQLERQDRIDLVLLDLLMPGLDGFSFVEVVRADPRFAALPIIVITAKDLCDEERKRLRGATQAMLQKKALTPEVLRSQLRALGLVGG